MNDDPRVAAEAGMRWLFAAVLQKLRELFGNRLPTEDLLAAARRALGDVSMEETGPSWEAALPCTVEQTQRVQRLRKPVVLVGMIAELTAPQVLCTEEGEVESVCMCVADSTGLMWSLDIMGADLVERAQRRWRTGGATQLLGVPIALPVAVEGRRPNFRLDERRQNFFLHVLDLRESRSTLDLLGATRDERERTEEVLADLHRRGVPPADFLYERVVETLSIVALEGFPLLGELLRFTTYQATSCGRIDHAPGRLHAMVAGPPGVGKKLLQLAAKLQNPVAVEASPTKVSAAGVVGASHLTAGGWRSTAGALARASGGVLLLQDAHGWPPTVARKLAPVLQEVMEDGVVRDSVAGGVVRQADAALLIDMNRTRHLSAATDGPEATLLTIRPVLSRADMLCDIPDDAHRAWMVGRQMCETVGARGTDDPGGAARELRLLVALLRDRHPHVDLGTVRQELGNAYDRIHETNRDLIATSPEAGDVPTRLAITFARYVSAIARAHDRNVAVRGDIEEAVGYVNKKLAFLRMIPTATRSERHAPTPEDFVASHSGERVRPSDLADQYERATGVSVHERTMRRVTQRLGGKRTGKGAYVLPPADNGTTGHADGPDPDSEAS